MKSRGLTIAPEIAVGDGALGFWKALDEVFPGTRHQRCWVHKTANVLNKVTLSVQTNMKKDLREIVLGAAASKTWRRLKGTNQLPKVIAGVRFENGIEVIQVPANHAA